MPCLTSDLVPSVDAATEQRVDVFVAVVHEATDEPIIAEDDAGHLGNVLPALVVTDVATVIHQAGHEVTLPQLLGSTFFNLDTGQEVRSGGVIELQEWKRAETLLTSEMVDLQTSMATDSNFGSVVMLSL